MFTSNLERRELQRSYYLPTSPGNSSASACPNQSRSGMHWRKMCARESKKTSDKKPDLKGFLRVHSFERYLLV